MVEYPSEAFQSDLDQVSEAWGRRNESMKQKGSESSHKNSLRSSPEAVYLNKLGQYFSSITPLFALLEPSEKIYCFENLMIQLKYEYYSLPIL
jgi:hypothetical protein